MSKNKSLLQGSLHDQLQDPSRKIKLNDELFTIVAPKYTIINRILSFGQDSSWKQWLLHQVAPYKPQIALDIATGTADLAWGLKKMCQDALVMGCDLNREMLRQNPSDVKKSVSFSLQNMQQLALKNESIDLITGGYALRNAPDLLKTLKEIQRIVKPGGYAAFLDFSKPAHTIVSGIQSILLKVWGSIWGLIMHGNPAVYGYIAESLSLYPDRVALGNLFSDTGFTILQRKVFMFGLIEICILQKKFIGKA